MAISYGTITITDKTDLGQLSVFLTGSTVNQQTCNINTEPDVYYPDWSTTALVITPHVYYNNAELDPVDFSIAWTKQENGGQVISIPKVVPDTTDPETYALDNRSLVRQKNLALNSSGVVYQATITYEPIANDSNTVITAIASISFSIASYGRVGDPGKSLQLIGDGTYFTYTWDDDLYGNDVIELQVQTNNIDYVCWECDGQSIYSGTHPSTSGSIKYMGTSLRIAGDGTATEGSIIARITTLSSNWATEGYAQFQIFEADSSGNKKANGFTDYFTIYKYKEAAPGDSLYTSYLDNNEETITMYQGVLDLSEAVTRLYINKDGSSDILNWHIGVTDTINNTSQFNYVVWNSLDYNNSSVFKGHSTTQITNNGTQNPTINGVVIQTSSLSINSLVSYYDNNNYKVFCWNGSKWTFNNTNLTKYGPDCAAVITFEINTAKINFNAQRGTYSTSGFTPDTNMAVLHNTFSVNKSASVIGHSLRLSAVNANKNTNNTYTPPTIEIAAVERSNGGVDPYTQQGSLAVIIHPKTGNAESRLRLTPPYTITLANEGDISYIETFLGDGSTSGSGIEDKQSISISTSGVDGTSPWLFTINNPYDSITTDYSYKVSSTGTYSIKLHAMKGSIPKVLYHKTNDIIYPNVIASCNVAAINNLLTYKYNGQPMVTSGTNAYKVDEIAFTVTGESTIIGQEGTITITFYSDANNSVSRSYTYKAIPAALAPITAQIYVAPSATFTNQTGVSIATPEILDGTTPIVGTAAIESYTWYAYIVGTGWKKLTNNSTPGIDEVHIDGVAVGLGNDANSWQNKANGTTESQQLKVTGSAVPGYLGFKLVANIFVGGASTSTPYTIPINFTDIDDPLHVTLHSTVGEQLINGQGAGVIYARVLMGDTIIDEIPPDNRLGVGDAAPENADNTGVFQNKLGYCVRVTNNLIDYYYRNSTSSNWQKREATTAKYSWYFRDNDNEPIIYVSEPGEDIPLNLNVLSQDKTNGQERMITNQQFVYITKDIVDTKLTADVKVEK